MKTWIEPLDQSGNATYSIDYSKEMARLGETLTGIVVTLSNKAITAGLAKALETISNNVFFVKFSIPNVANRIFTAEGKNLPMKVTYTSSNGETDSETFVLVIKDK